VSLLRLRVKNLRCLGSVDIEPGPNNLIVGENASGKTSLLEAIFILGRGRSFRTAGRNGLIRDDQESATVVGDVQREAARGTIGVGLDRNGPIRIRAEGKDASSAAILASWLPVQVIDPGVHRLVDESPGIRRRYLDWGVFHVKHDFLDQWRRYHRILRQRNAALKEGPRNGLAPWDEQLIAAAEAVTEAREAYLDGLAPEVAAVGEALLGERVALKYRRGWAEGKSFGDALQDAMDRDHRLGVTHPGPHRADVGIQFDRHAARGRVSRGQQKLLAAGLILGQLRHVRQAAGIRSLLLLDDMAAELDAERLGRFLAVVRELDVQLFVTALTPDAVALPEPQRMFHVERGNVAQMV
jgi:DNA replication and repair protein RecF